MRPSERLERAMWDFFWVPPDVRVIDRPELLALHCPRPVSYLNMVVRVRAEPEVLPGLIDEVRAVHPHMSRFMVADTFAAGPLENALSAAGYTMTARHDARILEVDRYTPGPGSAWQVRRVDSMERLEHSVAITDLAFAMTSVHSREALESDLAHCIDPNGRIHRFVAYDAAQNPVATGGLNLFPDLELGVLWGGGTVAEARGRGAYAAILATRIELARACGIKLVGLYAKTDTSSPIVARLGFARHGSLDSWDWPAKDR